jgi:hypothetical protein
MVFGLYDFTVRDRRRQAEDFAVINPGMTGDNTIGFARFEYDRCMCFHLVCKQFAIIITVGSLAIKQILDAQLNTPGRSGDQSSLLNGESGIMDGQKRAPFL